MQLVKYGRRAADSRYSVRQERKHKLQEEGLDTRYEQRQVLGVDASLAGFDLRSGGFTGSPFPLSALPAHPHRTFHKPISGRNIRV